MPDPDRHLDFAARQFADPRIARWHWPEHLGGPRTREQVRELLDGQAAGHLVDGFALWWWRERDTGELVGQVGLNRTEVEDEPMVEAGWSIRPERWGEGLATEAARASLSWGFEVAGLDEIVSFTLPENAASRRVMEKLGMGHLLDFERQGFPHVLYVLAG